MSYTIGKARVNNDYSHKITCYDFLNDVDKHFIISNSDENTETKIKRIIFDDKQKSELTFKDNRTGNIIMTIGGERVDHEYVINKIEFDKNISPELFCELYVEYMNYINNYNVVISCENIDRVINLIPNQVDIIRSNIYRIVNTFDYATIVINDSIKPEDALTKAIQEYPFLRRGVIIKVNENQNLNDFFMKDFISDYCIGRKLTLEQDQALSKYLSNRRQRLHRI